MSSGNDFVIHQSPPPPGDPHDSATPHHRPPPPPVHPPTVKSHYTMMQMEGQHVAFPMILPVVVVLFFLTTVYTIYLLRDLLQYFTATWVLRRSPNNTPPAQPPDTRPSGLDPSILASFPIFPYNSVRGLRNGKSELECAVCLSEFSDGDSLRLLTVCSHAFHPECIDLWLSSHTTCPVCRSNLDKPPQEGFVLSLQDSGEESHRISVKEEDGVVGEGSAGAQNSRQTEQFPKSHSTGHSLVMERRRRTDDEESDRYTLRLQYNGEEKHMLHSRIVSCITFREGSGDAAAARGAAAGSSGG